MKSKMKSQTNELVQTIGELAVARQQLARQAEQQYIAAILSTVDNAIEQTEALIAKQQRIKTGLMQDLLTGKVCVNSILTELQEATE